MALLDEAAVESRGRWKPYPEYRDSGHDWLGEVPAHWSTARLMEHVRLVNGFPFDSELFSRTHGIPLIRIRDLASDSTEAFYDGPAVDSVYIDTGDLIVGMDGDFNVALWRGGRALLNQRMCCLRPRRSLDRRFLYYVLPFQLQRINDVTWSTTIKHISSGQIQRVRIALPPVGEQGAIAAFLDRETARIDALIERKKRLTELLAENRTAQISNAIARGLGGNRRLKNSGVDWLGLVPEHWSVAPVYGRFTVQLGKMVDQKRSTGLELAPYLRNVNVQWDRVDTSDLDEMDFTERERSELRLRSGDLLVCEGGDVGRTASWRGELPECYFQKAILRVRPRRDDVPRFFFYVMCAAAAIGAFEADGNRSTIVHLTAEKLRHHRFAFPPLGEQREIVAFLDLQTARIDALVAKVRDHIALLREYRSGLISAAVTGKIDVRDEVAA